MAAPTWDGWPELIAQQKEDVETHCPEGGISCLLQVPWSMLTVPDWVPEMADTGIQWNTVTDPIMEGVGFEITSRIAAENTDLWTPVGEEDTNWKQVIYPR